MYLSFLFDISVGNIEQSRNWFEQLDVYSPQIQAISAILMFIATLFLVRTAILSLKVGKENLETAEKNAE